MKYILQSINGEIKNVEVWQAKVMLESAPRIYGLTYEIKDIEELEGGIAKEDGVIPVGSIQFCEKALGGTMYPVEVPPLMRTKFNLGREYKIVSTKNMKMSPFCFIKRVDRLKVRWTMSAITEDVISELDGDAYQVSEYIEMDAEYRIIVIRGEIVFVGWYNGRNDVFPNMEKVKLMVMQYTAIKGSAEAFTIDVGIKQSDSDTILIEIHPFVCCGTYGYSGLAGTEYLKALELGWSYYKSEYNRLIEVDEEWENGGSRYEITTVKNETITEDSKLDWQFESIRSLAKSLNIQYEPVNTEKSKIEILEQYKRKNRTA